MDRRLTPANNRAALDTLRGVVDAPRFTAGEPAQVALPLVDLLRAPEGTRERQFVLGEAVTVIDRHAGWAFVQAAKDGYCGYLPEGSLSAPQPMTHRVITPGTHLYSAPRVQAPEVMPLFLGARIAVRAVSGAWAETARGHVPAGHLLPLDQVLEDPACVAMGFLHTPYLWGGNSRAGIDCSGLVQGAFLSCGIDMPGDSDLQSALGAATPEEEPLRRNDLLFWKGHVAIALGPDRMVHATAAFMAVVEEGIAAAIARIEASGGGPVTHRRRILAGD
jgi:cell wall-associated NlpC family hydrolase